MQLHFITQISFPYNESFSGCTISYCVETIIKMKANEQFLSWLVIHIYTKSKFKV